MRLTLRTKLTLALMGMSLAAILAMGFAARSLMLRRFDNFIVARAMTGFEHEVTLYYRAYGSWEAAREAETFFAFVNRVQGRPVFDMGDAPPVDPAAQGPRRPRPGGAEGRPPRDDRPPRQGTSSRTFDMGGPAPPFIVTDLQGRVLLPLDGHRVGEQMPENLVARGRRLEVDGQTIGLAVPQVRPTLTTMEESYIASMNDAWLLSLLLAMGLSLPLGLFLGSRLTRPIRDLNDAMAEMEKGHLRQNVRSTARDELGQLSASFNRMSAKLADTYDELELSRATLAELSLRDELTGLYNRRAFDELATATLGQARRYRHDTAVAMLDIDHFKRINDQCGHAAGDEVLVRAGQILQSTLRETDIVARWGGEEFAVLFPETDGPGAAALAERIRAHFEQNDWSGLLTCPVTVSIGLTELVPGDSLADALSRADAQLYLAKESGRNRVHG